MAIRVTRAESKARTKDELTAAARRVFLEQGYHAASLDAIADVHLELDQAAGDLGCDGRSHAGDHVAGGGEHGGTRGRSAPARRTLGGAGECHGYRGPAEGEEIRRQEPPHAAAPGGARYRGVRMTTGIVRSVRA